MSRRKLLACGNDPDQNSIATVARKSREIACYSLQRALREHDGSGSVIGTMTPSVHGVAQAAPAPNDTIYLVMRLYWPKTEQPSILPPGEGTWKPPAIVATN